MKQLPPPQYLDEILQRINQIKELIADLEKVELPEHLEKVRIINVRGTTQFYLLKNSKDTKGVYIPKSQIAKIKEIVQGSYNKILLRTAKKELRSLTAFYKSQKRNVSTICNRYSEQRIKLLSLATLPAPLYAQKWLSTEYKGKTFAPETPVLLTSSNLRVRSKSEIIIAETLEKLGIPFRYEFPHKIGGTTFYPDFTCLNLRTRKEIIWEHFGLMDDQDYVNQALKKIALFQKQGYYSGTNFIFTMESGQSPLTSKQVAEIARHYLL